MKHRAAKKFWECYQELPKDLQELADKSYQLLKASPDHPSLHLKKVGRYWSVRIGLAHRALAVEHDGTLVWFWLGHHNDYLRRIRG